ncbi:MAG: hypothetical protein RIQ93_226 [Verrucomicrobiota bacterium]|jgi:acetyl esterase/lipase
MLRWFLFSALFPLFALSTLTVFKSPDWSQWRLAVLAGEYGHWLALASLGLAAAAWSSRGPGLASAAGLVLLGLAATGFFLKPTIDAWSVARTLPGKLASALGRVAIGRDAFSAAGWVEPGPTGVTPVTHVFASDLALDLYPAARTAEGSSRPPACVIVVHGGGWDSGDRKQLPLLNRWLAGRGYAVAAVSYRLAPKFIWPAQRDDLLAAIAFLKANAARLGVDGTRLVLLGRSAGGQIVEAVGYAMKDPAIRGIIGLYAPSDLHFGYAHAREDDAIKSPNLMRQYLGGPPAVAAAAYDSASALQHVTSSAPPTLLLHGRNDTLVWHRHSERLQARLAEQGVPHAFISLPWATHAFDFNLNGPGGQLTTFAVEWFLAAVTR